MEGEEVQETDSQTDRQWCRRDCWVKRTKEGTVQANSYTPPPKSVGMQGGNTGGLGAETGLWVGVGAIFMCVVVLEGSVRVSM